MSKKITLNQLIEELSDEALIPKNKSQEFINGLIETVLDEVNTKGKSAITNFGSFTVVEVAERTGVNPKTGDPLVIPAHKRISFTPYKALEKKVNRDFDHLEAKVVDNTSEPDQPKATEPVPASSEAERLLNTLISEENEEEEILEEPSFEQETLEDDPFNLGEDESEITPSDEIKLEQLEELENEPEDESGATEQQDSPTESKSFVAPGRPERTSNSLSPTVLLGVFAVFIIGVLAVWFLFLRAEPIPETASNTPQDILNDPSAFENEQVLNEVIDANEPVEIGQDEAESQVIPMVAADVDLSENPGEMMSIENQEPQIEYERFVAINYSVSSGVWIYEIARQTYGNTRLWPLIFQANYTLANNPDLILPNIELNIPQLEGSASDPTASDYAKLADAARYVAKAYENAGNTEQSAAYLKAADWYETMQ